MHNQPKWYSHSTPMLKINIDKNKVKKVFVLEDMEDRIDWFKKTFSFADYFMVTKNIDIALAEVRNEKFDLIFLDHDMAVPSIYEEARPDYVPERKGMEVIRELEKTINKETECIIHSMNSVAGPEMAKSHPFNTFLIPFNLLKDNLEII